MTVLRRLGRESEPVGLSELMLRLAEEYKERSLRRWLDLLVVERVVKKIGQKEGTKYMTTGRSEEGSGGEKH